jgi:hypothetical protein
MFPLSPLLMSALLFLIFLLCWRPYTIARVLAFAGVFTVAGVCDGVCIPAVASLLSKSMLLQTSLLLLASQLLMEHILC